MTLIDSIDERSGERLAQGILVFALRRAPRLQRELAQRCGSRKRRFEDRWFWSLQCCDERFWERVGAPEEHPKWARKHEQGEGLVLARPGCGVLDAEAVAMQIGERLQALKRRSRRA